MNSSPSFNLLRMPVLCYAVFPSKALFETTTMCQPKITTFKAKKRRDLSRRSFAVYSSVRDSITMVETKADASKLFRVKPTMESYSALARTCGLFDLSSSQTPRSALPVELSPPPITQQRIQSSHRSVKPSSVRLGSYSINTSKFNSFST